MTLLSAFAPDIHLQNNQIGNVADASDLADVCWNIAYYTKEVVAGVGDGLWNAGKNTLKLIVRPDQALYGIGCTIGWLGVKVFENVVDGCTILCSQDEEAVKSSWKAMQERITYARDGIYDTWQDATPRNVARKTTQFLTELYLQHKLATALTEFFSNAEQYADQLRRGISSLEKEEYLAQTPEGAKVSVKGQYVEAADEAAIETETQLHRRAHKNKSSSGNSKGGNSTSGSTEKPHRHNVVKVNNMKEFFRDTKFGRELSQYVRKTSQRYHNQPIYEVIEKTKYRFLKKGDLFYLDPKHKDHIEVFNQLKKPVCVLNINGTYNQQKSLKIVGREL